MSENKQSVLVVGSINLDNFLYMEEFPLAGQTVLARETRVAPGGKGFNFASTLHKLGVAVGFFAGIGADAFGDKLLSLIGKTHPLVAGLKKFEHESTGLAFIQVNTHGENTIAVHSGANKNFTFSDVPSGAFQACNFLVMCLENDVGLVDQCFALAKSLKKTTILNMSPFQRVPRTLLDHADIIVLNFIEFGELRRDMGLRPEEPLPLRADQTLVVTLGKNGAMFRRGTEEHAFPAFIVDKVVDTTGSGDSFMGGFVAEFIRSDGDLQKAINFGQKVAAIKIQIPGTTIDHHDYDSIKKADLKEH